MNGYRNSDAISQEEFTFAQGVIGKLGDYFAGRVVGQENLKKSLITAIVADGHILIESVPGLAKFSG
jgi:MoxR-like ATPase